MSGGQASYPIEAHSRISNSWLVEYSNDKNAVYDCRYPDGDPRHVSNSTGLARMPRGIMIRGDATADGNAAIVRGYLWGENSRFADDYYFLAGYPYDFRFQVVYARGTTARGIYILY